MQFNMCGPTSLNPGAQKVAEINIKKKITARAKRTTISHPTFYCVIVVAGEHQPLIETYLYYYNRLFN